MEATRARPTQTNTRPAPAATQNVVPPKATASSAAKTPLYAGAPPIRLGTPAPGSAAGTSQADVSEQVGQLVSTPGTGEPLRPEIQKTLEDSLEVDLSPVRVHTDERSAGVADRLNARAFTYGPHIFLGSRERPADLGLMAHEVAHVIQQRGEPVLQMSSATTAPDTFEREAQQVSSTVQQGGQATVTGRTAGPQVQKEDVPWYKRAARAIGRGASAVGTAVVKGAEAVGTTVSSGVKAVVEWTENLGWDLLKKYAPELVPIIQQGVDEWLKQKISSATEYVFNKLMAPVHTVTGVGQALTAHFTALLTWMQDAAAKIAKGDCSSFAEAATNIHKVIDGFTSPIIDRVKQLSKKVGDFFSDVWKRFGVPAWDHLKNAGGQAWEKIQQFSTGVWTKTEPIRKATGRAWTWIKNKLGIGEGPEGQNGILQWVQRKAEGAWGWIKAKIEPFKKPLLIVGGVLLLLSPAGPLIALGAGVAGLIVGIRWIHQHWHTPQFVIQMRETLHNTIIPGIMNAVNSVKSALTRATNFITGKLNEVMVGLSQAIKPISDPFLKFAGSAMRWLTDQFHPINQWANEKLTGLTNRIGTGLDHLRTYLQPVWQVLRKVIGFVANPFSGLTGFLFGSTWKALPQCLKSIIINFLLDVMITSVRIARFIPDTLMLGPLWFLIRTAALGFLQKVRSYGDEVKTAIVDRFANLATQGSFEFAKGYLKGVVLGLWDGISGPFVLIWDIIKLIGGLFQFLWRTIQTMSKPETYRRILQGLQNAWQTIQTKIVPAIEEFFSGKTNPLKIIGFIREIVGKVLKAVEGIGGSIADALLKFLNQPDAELGESLGRFVGNILFEAILIALTSGGYAAKPVIQRLSRWVTSATLRVAEFVTEVVAYFPKLMTAVESIGEFASNNRAMRAIIDALKSLLRGLFDFIKMSYGLAGAEERGLAKSERALTESGQFAGDVGRKLKLIDDKIMRSSNELLGVERASEELIRAISSKRTVEIAKIGSEEMRYLDYIGAEANVGGEQMTHIILRPDPSKAAILEEFLHGTQKRLGIIDKLGHSGMGSAETHVKDFMIRHKRLLGLGEEDVKILKILRDKGL